MKYNQIVADIVRNIGGTENILKVTHGANTICFKVFNAEEVSQEKIGLIEGVKKVVVEANEVVLTFLKRHTRYLFDAIKELPGATVKPIEREEDNEMDSIWANLPYFKRLSKSISSDILPLILGLVLMGYLYGILNFVGHVFGGR